MKPKEKYFKNREKLINYVEQSKSPELKKFVDTLLMLERWKENRPKARLTISIGKAEFENDTLIKFFPILSSRTDDPTVFVNAYKNEPFILIEDRTYCNDTITSISLNDITDLKVDEQQTKIATYFSCTFHSKYNNLDYMIKLIVTK